MRFSRVGTCFVIVGLYLVARIMPLALYKGFQNPMLAWLLSIGLTAVTMLVQLAYAVSIVRLKLPAKKAALLALASGVVAGSALYAMYYMNVHHPFHGGLTGFIVFRTVDLLKDVFLILFATSLGYLISFIIREPNILLPASFFAGIVDYWGVTSGPVAHMLAKTPNIVSQASVHMPKVIVHSAHKVYAIDSMIGMGDFLFFALFMGALYRFNMNVKGAFWYGYALLTAFMLFVMFSSRGVAIPALVPMGVAILLTNAKNFKLNREELLAMLYVGILLFVGLIAMLFFTHGK